MGRCCFERNREQCDRMVSYGEEEIIEECEV